MGWHEPAQGEGFLTVTLVDRLVCWLIRRQLGGKDVVLQKAGVDFDLARFSEVYPVREPGTHKFMVVLSKTIGADTKLGFVVQQYAVEVVQIRWDKARQQYLVSNYDGPEV